jgi:hypothetical protein
VIKIQSRTSSSSSPEFLFYIKNIVLTKNCFGDSFGYTVRISFLLSPKQSSLLNHPVNYTSKFLVELTCDQDSVKNIIIIVTRFSENIVLSKNCFRDSFGYPIRTSFLLSLKQSSLLNHPVNYTSKFLVELTCDQDSVKNIIIIITIFSV